MAGVPCAMEFRDFIIDSEARPDLVLFSTDKFQVDSMTDVRTADKTVSRSASLQLPEPELLRTRPRC